MNETLAQPRVNSAAEIRVGIIGLGFMGKTHAAAYQSARAAGWNCRLAAVADRDVERALAASAGNLGGAAPLVIGNARRYSEASQLLADGDIDLVSICTPTDTHADLAIAALRAGKHVLIEKPVAVRRDQIEAVAREAILVPGQICMPAMVMRFWPGWPWLRDRIREARADHDRSAARPAGQWGAFVGLTLQRLGSMPSWNAEFYRDPARSGGALTDLHIHDTDFVYWCFGKPTKVTSLGSLDHCTTLYRFAGDLAPRHVVAQGGWGHQPPFPFTMKYTAMFENATVVFDLASGSCPITVFRDGKSEIPDLPPVGGYDAQVRHTLDAIAAVRDNQSFELRATLADALAVSDILEAERLSQTKGGCQTV